MHASHGRIHGVTFLSYDGPDTTDSHTLLSLMRIYSTLNISSPQSLSPPHRIIFPALPIFADPARGLEDETPRIRSNIGVAPETLKAAYPSLVGALFEHDFEDFNDIDMPVLLDRVILSDRGAARNSGLSPGMSAWSPPFTSLRASEDWFEPVRRLLAQLVLEEDESDSTTRKHAVTYISRQGSADSERLLAADHGALLEGLQNLARTGVKVFVIDENASWMDRMRALAQSTVSLIFCWTFPAPLPPFSPCIYILKLVGLIDCSEREWRPPSGCDVHETNTAERSHGIFPAKRIQPRLGDRCTYDGYPLRRLAGESVRPFFSLSPTLVI
jgi:hypothetical protein